MQDAKLTQIAAGTSEVLKLLIYRQGTKRMEGDLKVPRARGSIWNCRVPLPLGKFSTPSAAGSTADTPHSRRELSGHPGLHMTLEDIRKWIGIEEVDLVKYLESLEEKDTSAYTGPGRGSPWRGLPWPAFKKRIHLSITATFLNGWIE